jgi:hypothetical protein
MKTVFAILLILAGAALMYLPQTPQFSEQSQSSIQKNALLAQMETDLNVMSRKPELENIWPSIREVRQITTTPITRTWAGDMALNLKINQNGNYRLEYILIAETPENPQSRRMVQFGLYDNRDNKIWEELKIYPR